MGENMSYDMRFYGEFSISPKLTEADRLYLVKFSETQRMKRDRSILKAMYGEDFGVDGEWFVGGKGHYGQEIDQSVVSPHHPPSQQPSKTCDWIPNADGTAMLWNGQETCLRMQEWITYLCTKFFGPRGYTLNGFVKAFGEDGYIWAINIQDNYVQYVNSHNKPELSSMTV